MARNELFHLQSYNLFMNSFCQTSDWLICECTIRNKDIRSISGTIALSNFESLIFDFVALWVNVEVVDAVGLGEMARIVDRL